MANISKAAADKLSISRGARKALEVHGPKIVEGFERWIFEGEKPRKLSVQELFQALDARLARAEKAYEQREAAHQAELGDDDEPRVRRERQVTALKKRLLSSSGSIRGAFGEGYSRLVGLEAALEERPDRLVAQALRCAEQLRKNVPATEPLEGVKIDRSVLAKALESEARSLADSLSDVLREGKEAEQTKIARDRAEEEWGLAYEVAAGIAALGARAAGEAEVAERIRATPRRRAGVIDEPAPAGGGAPPPADPSAA